ncbi:conserved hypothetical protein [Sinorhizobium medicae]|uniref:Uncharacterized protein n=1 Tax=Sinorhizobium medicae TaxID=110321 RepID=A0A508X1K4_9HYPH|nr:conserved hypothetical protein [Sinorhizobium medicae]
MPRIVPLFSLYGKEMAKPIHFGGRVNPPPEHSGGETSAGRSSAGPQVSNPMERTDRQETNDADFEPCRRPQDRSDRMAAPPAPEPGASVRSRKHGSLRRTETEGIRR